MKKKWIKALASSFCPDGMCSTGIFRQDQYRSFVFRCAFPDAMGIAGDKAKLGWLMTSFLLAYGFSSVFLSFLGDIFNPKKCCSGA